MQTSNEESEVRACVEALARALREKDVETLMARYAPDVVTFDVQPPLHVVGEGYRRNFERWFGSVDGSIAYEMHEVNVTASGGVAFCRCLSHVRSRSRDGEPLDYWVRVTSCFEKRLGEWKITHEHVSMPVDMRTLQAGGPSDEEKALARRGSS